MLFTIPNRVGLLHLCVHLSTHCIFHIAHPKMNTNQNNFWLACEVKNMFCWKCSTPDQSSCLAFPFTGLWLGAGCTKKAAPHLSLCGKWGERALFLDLMSQRGIQGIAVSVGHCAAEYFFWIILCMWNAVWLGWWSVTAALAGLVVWFPLRLSTIKLYVHTAARGDKGATTGCAEWMIIST